MEIRIVRNTDVLHGFSDDMAVRFGVKCAVVYNALACRSKDYLELPETEMEKNAENRATFEDDTLWVRYKTEELFQKMFTYLDEKAIKKAIKKLEQNKLLKIRPDKEDGFILISVAFELE